MFCSNFRDKVMFIDSKLSKCDCFLQAMGGIHTAGGCTADVLHLFIFLP